LHSHSHLYNQIQPLDYFIFADAKDERRIVVDHGAVLELALGLYKDDVSLYGTSSLFESLNQDALLDVPIFGHIPPVVLNKKVC
jgi:hypothetical protein